MAEWRTRRYDPGREYTYKITVFGPGSDVESDSDGGKRIFSAAFVDGVSRDKEGGKFGSHLALLIRRIVPEAVIYSGEISEGRNRNVTNPDIISKVSKHHTSCTRFRANRVI
jgi:hypothetical protein